mmetsp:Transcript_3802/g.9403  ORF Transcript_3802/g.9403 Transcript_3802/m.9403 type:complete len:215 (+) Transcript_3802:196-840(+)
MVRTNGLVLPVCCPGSLRSNAKLVGTSGLIPVSRRRNGRGKKTRNFCTWPRSCLLSGERLRPLSVARRRSALNGMRSSWTRPCEVKVRPPTRQMIPASSVQEKSTRTLSTSQLVQTRWIWMRMRRKCSPKLERGLQTQGVRRQSEKPEKNSSRRLAAWRPCKNDVNCALLEWKLSAERRDETLLITMQKFLSNTRPLSGFMRSTASIALSPSRI